MEGDGILLYPTFRTRKKKRDDYWYYFGVPQPGFVKDFEFHVGYDLVLYSDTGIVWLETPDDFPTTYMVLDPANPHLPFFEDSPEASDVDDGDAEEEKQAVYEIPELTLGERLKAESLNQ